MGYCVTITGGMGKGRQVRFHRPRVRIGRLPDNDLVLTDPSVSRLHCEIAQTGRSLVLRDAGSVNGTLLNDMPAHGVLLRPGDRIQLGATVLTVSDVELPVASTGRRRWVLWPLLGGAALAAALGIWQGVDLVQQFLGGNGKDKAQCIRQNPSIFSSSSPFTSR
ncbi:MAG TPA: FHA domain-containing protein [Myxococcota bacterium]|nr:FHA domain-containing protein [Myxococcota bacterium]